MSGDACSNSMPLGPLRLGVAPISYFLEASDSKIRLKTLPNPRGHSTSCVVYAKPKGQLVFTFAVLYQSGSIGERTLSGCETNIQLKYQTNTHLKVSSLPGCQVSPRLTSSRRCAHLARQSGSTCVLLE